MLKHQPTLDCLPPRIEIDKRTVDNLALGCDELAHALHADPE
jgi:hypothetical protein